MKDKTIGMLSVIAIIVLAWFASAAHQQAQISKANYNDHCDAVERWHMDGFRGIAPELRRGEPGERC